MPAKKTTTKKTPVKKTTTKKTPVKKTTAKKTVVEKNPTNQTILQTSNKIEFRGIVLGSKEEDYVYGYFLKEGEKTFIVSFKENKKIEVIPQSVGQFSGILIHGEEIFEGDSIEVDSNSSYHSYRGKVIRDGASFSIEILGNVQYNVALSVFYKLKDKVFKKTNK